ncbi:H-NS family nucleoid-associated regulatory protein, partial [Vibrio sp. 10N.222.49.A4]
KLTTVFLERQESEEVEREARAEQESKVAEIAKQIKVDGVNIEALIEALAGQSKNKIKGKRKPRLAKYSYTDGNGIEKTWTGQGRTPSIIQEQLDAGKSIEDFLIAK